MPASEHRCVLDGVGALLAGAAALLAALPVAADDFYKGRQITMICGFSPGGGYDLYARLLARHIGNQIPGRPSVVVQNMEGASTVRASNYVYVSAPKDGTVIAAVNQNMPLYQLLGGRTAQFEAAKLQWLGSIIGSNGTLYTWHTSPTKSIADARTRETILGGTGTNSDSHIYPTFINNTLGTRFKVINGYTGGTREINIALERGEVEGRGGNSWAGLISSSKPWVDAKKLNFLVQIGFTQEPAPELAGIPLLIDLMANEEDRKVAAVVTLPTAVGFAYWLAAEVPAERMSVLRRAFDATMQDAHFLAEAEKSQAQVRAQSGEAVEAMVKQAAATPRPLIERAGRLLEWKE